MQAQLQPTPDDIKRLMDMPATSEFGDLNAFTGGVPPNARGPSSAPSRMLMQQLTDAGKGGRWELIMQDVLVICKSGLQQVV